MNDNEIMPNPKLNGPDRVDVSSTVNQIYPSPHSSSSISNDDSLQVKNDFPNNNQEAPGIISQKPKRSHFKIVLLSVALISIVAIVVVFVFLKPFGSKSKTISEFEEIMNGMGYSKVNNSAFSYSDSDGSFVTYTKGNNSSVDGVAMFYEMSSRSKLQQLVESELSGYESYKLFEDFDWSKDYNSNNTCSDKKPYICFNVIQRDNTLLLAIYHSDSLGEAKDESNAIVEGMDY